MKTKFKNINKQILFSLLLITTANTHGMEVPTDNSQYVALFDDNIMSHITQYLCINNNYKHHKIRNDIRALSDTNNFFHYYYTREEVKQGIIRLCSDYNNISDRLAAKHLGCRAIKKEIERLRDIARSKKKMFSPEDLKKDWYLNSTSGKLEKQLLYRAIDALNLKSANAIIDYSKKLNFLYTFGQDILCLIANLRSLNKNKKELLLCIFSYLRPTKNITQHHNDELLRIAQRLLQKKIDPDRGCKERPLTITFGNNDTLFTRLLLEHDADPYIRKYCLFCHQYHPYDYENEPEGWFAVMINDIRIYKYWLLKNYTPDPNNTLPQKLALLPQEIALLIIHILLKTTQ